MSAAVELALYPLLRNDPALVHYWRMEVDVPPDYYCVDDVGDYHGTANLTSAPGKFNKCAPFDGSNADISFYTGPDFGTAGTISMWIMFGKGPVIEGSFDDPVMTVRITSDGVSQYGLKWLFEADTAYDSYNAAFTPGVWHHMALTWDTSPSQKVYLDGNLIDGNTANVSLNSPGSGFQFGVSWTVFDRFTGSLDDVAFFNRALTPTEISNYYNNITPAPATNKCRRSSSNLGTRTGTRQLQ